MEQFCTLENAKTVLGVYDDTQNDEITEAIEMATAVILDYCQVPDSTAFTQVQRLCAKAAALKLIPIIYDGTGEKAPDLSQANGELPKSVTMFINRIKRNIIA